MQGIMNNTEGLLFFDTSGFSMWPFMRQGEKLVIKKARIDDLRVGDIILYRANNQIVCHRLVKKIMTEDGYSLYARGDNSNSSPELVPEAMFSGKAIGIIKSGKVISLTNCGRRLNSRLIVMIAPLIAAANRMIQPYYAKFRKRK